MEQDDPKPSPALTELSWLDGGSGGEDGIVACCGGGLFLGLVAMISALLAVAQCRFLGRPLMSNWSAAPGENIPNGGICVHLFEIGRTN